MDVLVCFRFNQGAAALAAMDAWCANMHSTALILKCRVFSFLDSDDAGSIPREDFMSVIRKYMKVSKDFAYNVI